MGSRTSRNRIAIFGSGKVGTAMSLEMPGVPVVSRGEDCLCDIACICWPAHALKDFERTHPLASLHGTVRVAFSNGVWAVEDGRYIDHQGICYVRVVDKGYRAAEGYKGWRVGIASVSKALQQAGLSVVCSRSDHIRHLWCKCMYILPLAFTCADTGLDAKSAARTEEWREWYELVKVAAAKVIGDRGVEQCEKRALFLTERSPRGWKPSPTVEELEYFKEKICAS